jgi:drug/metabolite transporter (DMT)-like permease
MIAYLARTALTDNHNTLPERSLCLRCWQTVTMNSGILFAVLAPLFWGLADVSHKYIISHKIRNGMSYLVIWGGVQLAAGIILASFLDWRGVTFTALLFPFFSGLLYGIESFLYITILRTEEVSHVLGFVYLYPAVTALLSWVFLNEVHGPVTYAGVLLVIIGVTFLSIKLGRQGITLKIFGLLFLMGTMIGVHVFLVKMATIRLGELQGISIDIIALGATLMLALFSAPVRRSVPGDVRHLPWVLLGNVELFGLACGYFAMARLSATIVSSIGALQIVVVIILEHFLERRKGSNNYLGERRLFPKLIPLSIIMAGVSMISSQELYSMIIIAYWQ